MIGAGGVQSSSLPVGERVHWGMSGVDWGMSGYAGSESNLFPNGKMI